MPTTSPDNIWYAQRSDGYSAESISALEASSIQEALNVMRVPEQATDVITSTQYWNVYSQLFTRIDRTVYWNCLATRLGGNMTVNDTGWITSGGATIGTVSAAWRPPRQSPLNGGAAGNGLRPVTGGALLPDGTIRIVYLNGTGDFNTDQVVSMGGVYTLV